MNILAALDDPNLLGARIRDPDSWRPWREDELGVEGAPRRCTLVPIDMRVISRGLGGFPWQNVKVRFVDTDTTVIEGWMASSDLRN